ncbi:hypothetical protein VE00_01768 [Pseudogymnoascus sp. WSF 3629]|nr:hypothetical protein VE00_01768 [Pseudogymnoascus sp. WSF 3629]
MAPHHPSPTVALHMGQQHQGPPNGPPGPQAMGPGPGQQGPWPTGPPSQNLTAMNEAVWMQIGSFLELVNSSDEAIIAYEHALRANPHSIVAMTAIAGILRHQEQFPKAVDFIQNILKLDPSNGEIWGSLGHCYLMMDDLQQAYAAYQQALYHLRDPKKLQEPRLWYGIGILYDRYGSYEHAEEAFSQVMHMAPDFEKSNEIYFRLGIIYKQQQKYSLSLECFKYIVSNPPAPLTEEDIWFQIGHVHEQQKDVDNAKLAYRRVLDRDPNHAKVLQQLGWLHHQQSPSFASQEQAIEYLEKSVNSDNNDAQSWYLLGRCYMSQQKYPKAYEAYQQAVYRDGRNPTFWCSIGVLYYQINQYRDALDAYSRAIRLNPYISEVWYDLGTLYESCNNQISDALDAYQRANELDPSNVHIKARLQLLRSGQGMPTMNTAAPIPQDVHPNAYQPTNAVGPPGPQWGAPSQAAPPAPSGPPAGPGPGNWPTNRLAEINPPPQPPNPYEHREAARAPPPPPRQASPRPDQQMRPYQEPRYLGPVPPHRAASPHPLPGPYPGQGVQHPPTIQQQQPPLAPPQPHAAPSGPVRVLNPNYGGPAPNILPPAPQNGLNGPPPPGGPGPIPPFGRGNSPHPEVRPILDNRISSPTTAYPHQPYQPHAETPAAGGIANGAPAPASALAAAEAAAAERRDEGPPSVGPKRVREWEDELPPVQKKPASDETRAHLNDVHHRRPSTPPREPFRRNSSEARREDQRRANENYHPSEAAHHPLTHSVPTTTQLPPMQPAATPTRESLPPPPSVSKDYPMVDGPAERRSPQQLPPPPPPPAQAQPQPPQPQQASPPAPVPAPAPAEERAARKMDVDENYDDEGEEEKKAPSSANGAPPSAPGSAGGAPAVEGKTESPERANGAGAGFLANGQNGAPAQAATKVEGTA